MRRSEKKSCLAQLDQLDKAIHNSNTILLQEYQELDELEKKVAKMKEKIDGEAKIRDQNTKTFDIISERLLDEKTIQNAVSYGIKKGILDAASISIPPNAKFDQLSIEQRKALIDILKVQNKNNSFLSTINKGIDYCDYLLDMVITDGRCQEDLENDN